MWEEGSAVGNAVALSTGEAVPPRRTFHMSTACIGDCRGVAPGTAECRRPAKLRPLGRRQAAARADLEAFTGVLYSIASIHLSASPPCPPPRTTQSTSNALAYR